MPQPPGIVLMPTTLLNAGLGLLPDRTIAVRGPDRVAAIVPMFDEASGAGAALEALLAQQVPVDALVLTINGGSDDTPAVVAATLAAAGYARSPAAPAWPGGPPARTWRRERAGPAVVVVHHDHPVAKADSINLVLANGLVSAERVLVVDGDTVLDPGFVAAMRDGFYRLRRVRGAAPRFVLEDTALQSGAVTSAPPQRPGLAGRWVSAARTAEYAFATLVRRGQVVRLGRGPTFGASRLYTVIGCGFVARRDQFPVPSDTLTEDHDLTISVQSGVASARMVSAANLHDRGFRALVDGREVPLAALGVEGDVELRTTPHARFEAAASMATEDPPHVPAYLGQVERWVGGGLENLIKRVRRPAGVRAWTPNTRFVLLAGLLENVAGLLLLMVGLPALLGVALADGGGGALARGLGAWFAADVAFTAALVFLGAWHQARGPGLARRAALALALRRTLVGVVPLVLLRPLNAVAYVAAATRVLPQALAARPAAPRATATWQRPRAIASVARTRTAGVASVMVAVSLGGFAVSAHVATLARPLAGDAWRHLSSGPVVELAPHAVLPVAAVALPNGGDMAGGAASGAGPAGPGPRDGGDADGAGVSAVCAPSFVAASAGAPRRLGDDAGTYGPLTSWGLLTLARLAPLLALVEEAATAYDVPPSLLLQVLLNESYLDPLAVGPTDDVGLSQVTSDALTLLRSISSDRGSPFANPRLFARPFSAYDPDFSACAGAAKLAWVRHLPGGGDDEIAYARYVNPWDGVVDGAVSARHRPLVDAFAALRPMVDELSAVVGAFRADPASVRPAERRLLEVAEAVARRESTIEDAYRRTAEVVAALRVADEAFYAAVLDGLYGAPTERAEAPAWTLADAVR